MTLKVTENQYGRLT